MTTTMAPAPPPVATTRWRQAGAHLLDRLRRAPFSVGLTVALWVLGAATGSLVLGPGSAVRDRFGAGWPALADGRWWAPLTSALWCRNLMAYVLTSILLLTVVAMAERRLGTTRTVGLFVVAQVFGVLLALLVVKSVALWAADAWPGQLVGELAVSPAVGVLGVSMAYSYWLSARWRRRLRLFLGAATVITALYAGFLPDGLRLGGLVVGLGLGYVVRPLWGGPTERARGFAPSHAESRVLVAIVVGVAGLGALVAGLLRAPIGPLSDYSFLFSQPPPSGAEITSICGDPGLPDLCHQVRVEHAVASGPGRIVAAVPALLLLVAAEGLRRGRRLAWWLALAINLVLLGLAGWVIADGLTGEDLGMSTASYLGQLIPPLLLPIGTVILLIATRQYFTLPTAKALARKVGLTVLTAFVGLSLIYVVVAGGIREQFDPAPRFGKLLLDLPARFLPPVYANLLTEDLLPKTGGARWLFHGIGPLFWLITLAGLLLLWWRAAPRQGAAEAEVAAGLMRQGGSNLAYMSTWPGNSHWIAPDGLSAVPYRVLATVALTTGDPLGLPQHRADAVRGFAEYCAHNGWTPCFYSVTEDVRRVAETELGWKSTQIAEDTVVPVLDLAFTGKKWQDIRTALNKAEKEGISARWYTYPTAPLAITDQVRSISEEWVADKGLPEMGFTLGGLAELADENVRMLVAVDTEYTVHGVTSWLPVYRDGVTVGYTLDFMRRRSEGFRGVMEFLIASAALTFKEEGAEFLSLSGAPLARLDRGVDADALQKLLDATGRALEPVYGFRSLFAFKAKFQPTYQPMYMTYPDGAALPAIANAVGRAYVPDLSPVQGVRLVKQIGWGSRR